jgi:hypothetical protein
MHALAKRHARSLSVGILPVPGKKQSKYRNEGGNKKSTSDNCCSNFKVDEGQGVRPPVEAFSAKGEAIVTQLRVNRLHLARWIASLVPSDLTPATELPAPISDATRSQTPEGANFPQISGVSRL